jgi:hypothetical protein
MRQSHLHVGEVLDAIVRLPVLRRIGGRMGVGLHGVALGVPILSKLLPNSFVQLFARNKDREFFLGDEGCKKTLPAGCGRTPKCSAFLRVQGLYRWGA